MTCKATQTSSIFDACQPARLLLLALLTTGCGPRAGGGEDTASRELLRLAHLDPAALSAKDREQLLRLARTEKCPCPGSQESLAACAAPGDRGAAPGCPQAPFALRFMARALHAGAEERDISLFLRERYAARPAVKLDLAQAPCRGRAGAPVTLVVFSDFQCPFCSLARLLVDRVARVAGDRLRVCFKQLPLASIHEHARLAAQATVAAQLQGKFWPLHDRLFDRQDQLEPAQLEAHARAVGLDLERFRTDLYSTPVRARVDRDVAEAVARRIRGTPTFILNGREMTDPKTVPDFLDWIAEAVVIGGNGLTTSQPTMSPPAAGRSGASQPTAR